MGYSVEDRIAALHQLGVQLSSTNDEKLQAAIRRAHSQNAWFTVDNINKSIRGIVQHFLQKDKLTNWLSRYNVDQVSPKRVGLILAGNIPLVGFHDLLCVYASGHQAVVKYSSKDAVLVKYIVELLAEIDPKASEQITFIEKLENYQAVIATGSNNTSKYFEEYFKHVPHIIRKNRNGVGVIHGDETAEDFVKLGEDIFTYFGLGCRNVSKIYVPKDYEFDLMLQTLHDNYKELVLHHKYKNNFDYNHALFMLNKDQFLMSGSLMVRKDNAIQSRISSINYEHYDSVEKLAADLASQLDDIQCVVSNKAVGPLAVFALGEAQKPALTDYADGVDTMQFLTDL